MKKKFIVRSSYRYQISIFKNVVFDVWFLIFTACGLVVYLFCKKYGKISVLYTPSTVGHNYLTSQVIFMNSLCSKLTQSKVKFTQALSGIPTLLSEYLYPQCTLSIKATKFN